MIPRTSRKPGKIDPAEVKYFQERYGLQVDGKFGWQSLGQVLEIERAYRQLELKPEPQCTLWGAVLAAGGVVTVWAFGLLDWLYGLL